MAHIGDGTRTISRTNTRKGPVRGDDNEPGTSSGKGTGKGADIVLFRLGAPAGIEVEVQSRGTAFPGEHAAGQAGRRNAA
jgi:hypothetical protein